MEKLCTSKVLSVCVLFLLVSTGTSVKLGSRSMVMQGRKKYTLKLGSVEAEVHEQAVCIGDYMGTSVGYGAPESCFDLCLSVDGCVAAQGTIKGIEGSARSCMFFSDLTGVNPSHRFEKACVKITKLHRRKGRFIKAVTETGGKIYAGKGRSWVCARVPLPGYSSFTGTSTYRDSRCRTRCLAEPACKSYAYHYLNAHDVNAFKCTLCLNKLTETRPSTIFPSRRETTLYQFGYNLAALTPEDIIRSGYWRNRGKANIAYTVGRHNSEMLSAAFQEGTTTVEEYSNAVEASVGIEWKVFSAGGKYERTWGTSTAEMDSATREFAQTRGETYEHTCDFSCSGTVYQYVFSVHSASELFSPFNFQTCVFHCGQNDNPPLCLPGMCKDAECQECCVDSTGKMSGCGVPKVIHVTSQRAVRLKTVRVWSLASYTSGKPRKVIYNPIPVEGGKFQTGNAGASSHWGDHFCYEPGKSNDDNLITVKELTDSSSTVLHFSGCSRARWEWKTNIDHLGGITICGGAPSDVVGFEVEFGEEQKGVSERLERCPVIESGASNDFCATYVKERKHCSTPL